MPLYVADDVKAGPTLARLLRLAVSALNDAKAPESLYIPSTRDIEIYVEDGLGFITRPTRYDRGDLSFKFKPSHIIVGSQSLAAAGCVGQLAALGALPQDAMLCCLAHELFHVDESQRLSSQGVTFFEANSRFTWAIRSSLPLDHNSLLRSCARKYRGAYSRDSKSTFPLMPVDVARAQDVAAELCADLLALHWMGKAGVNTAAIALALQALRTKDEAKSLAEYQIGAELPNFLNLQSFDEIVAATSTRCFQILATSPDVDPVIREDASALPLPVAMSHDQEAIQATLEKPPIFDLMKPIELVRSAGRSIKRLGKKP